MEIIREGPSASHPPVLDGKNYSYSKPRMIFFIKTLHGKAWRALVAGYDPSMITVNGVSVPKPEVDWTDAKEKASVGNAISAQEAWKTLEVAYEGTSKVKISRLQLITSKFEALRMTEDESVSEYNKRVIEITNESLLLGEKIPDSKIVRKVLRSLPRKFDMKVNAIEEAHDITTLKHDELFGSLLMFEMATADRENKKGKGISFKSSHVDEEAAECPTFLRKQKKNFRVTPSDEESGDSRDDDDNINAFTIRITDENTDDESECSEERTENLYSILKSGHNGSHRHGLGFVASASRLKATSEIKFVPASMGVEHETIHTETGTRTTVKSLGRTCYYCGRKGHIRLQMMRGILIVGAPDI
ncbi:gag-pol polyprotein [Cucumis melo var. makuwa]|uniref:Gag-pol polyprotein n=1 Tax=Cucumis melo var. makuwa TaxID=1194695 RepID=A0A5A7V3L0_CUCMM|nr:gag-pol polyprotein [Cucumis melo var. makuwa]